MAVCAHKYIYTHWVVFMELRRRILFLEVKVRLVAHILLIIYFKKILSHDTVEFEQKINMINNKAVRVPTKQH